ncbi:MAG TPA: hypothetical protein VK504_21115 [Vicinamibacterales bacterium]|nr:hypothetical protein [Vicinamibacterales bacterium]
MKLLRLLAQDRFEWLRATRRRLIQYTWGAPTLPSTLATTVTRSYTGPSYRTDYTGGLAHCSRVDRYMCTTLGGATSEAHLLYPPPGVAPLNRLLLMHGGHVCYWDYPPGSGDNTNEVGVIDRFLVAGWNVLGVSQPSWPYNPADTTITWPDTTVHVYPQGGAHDFSNAEAVGMRTMRLFLDGALFSLNQAIADLHPARVAMSGISGGGWSTDWLAAVDTRIQRSYPVCGSVPYDVRALIGGSAVGDFEQAEARPWWASDVIGTRAGLDRTLIVYALGCFDTGRRRVQTLVDGDTVYTAAGHHAAITAYAAQVDALVPPGQHAVRIDPYASAYHTIPDATCAAILADANS